MDDKNYDLFSLKTLGKSLLEDIMILTFTQCNSLLLSLSYELEVNKPTLHSYKKGINYNVIYRQRISTLCTFKVKGYLTQN